MIMAISDDDDQFRRESETTEYDCSTDDESLRFLMSETDQVRHDHVRNNTKLCQ